jgi:hypothetical protein
MRWEVQAVGDSFQCVLLDNGRFIDRQGFKSWINGKFYPWLWKSRLCADLICADLNTTLKRKAPGN